MNYQLSKAEQRVLAEKAAKVMPAVKCATGKKTPKDKIKPKKES